MDDAALLDALAGTWAATSAVLHDISVDEFDADTGCPGWTVKDQLSHLVWSAGIWCGVAPAPIDLPELAHVRGPMAEYMELAVEARRGVAGHAVLAEFDDLRTRAIDDLRGRLPDGLDAPFAGPMGHQMPRRAFLGIAVFDQWVHGEDIRAALGLEADRLSPAAQHSVTQLVGAWKAKAAEAPAIDVVIDNVEHRLGTGEVRGRVQLRFDDLVTRGAGRQRDVDPPIVSGDEAAVDRMLGLLPVTR